MSDLNHQDKLLLEKINNLQETVSKGFAGVHARQDKTNGYIDRHSSEIRLLEISDEKLRGSLKEMKVSKRYTWLYSAILGILLSVIGILVGMLLKN